MSVFAGRLDHELRQVDYIPGIQRQTRQQLGSLLGVALLQTIASGSEQEDQPHSYLGPLQGLYDLHQALRAARFVQSPKNRRASRFRPDVKASQSQPTQGAQLLSSIELPAEKIHEGVHLTEPFPTPRQLGSNQLQGGVQLGKGQAKSVGVSKEHRSPASQRGTDKPHYRLDVLAKLIQAFFAIGTPPIEGAEPTAIVAAAYCELQHQGSVLIRRQNADRLIYRRIVLRPGPHQSNTGRFDLRQHIIPRGFRRFFQSFEQHRRPVIGLRRSGQSVGHIQMDLPTLLILRPLQRFYQTCPVETPAAQAAVPQSADQTPRSIEGERRLDTGLHGKKVGSDTNLRHHTGFHLPQLHCHSMSRLTSIDV